MPSFQNVLIMTVVRSKQFAAHQEKYNDLAIKGRDMLGCDPANTYALKSCPVLEGDEAIEFYERWQKLLEEPMTPLSEEERKERKEWKKYFKEQMRSKI